MQAGKVSSLSAFPFGRADISIRERSNLSKGKDVCVRSTRHVPRFPWQPQAVRAPVSKQPAGFHQCLRCGNVVWFLSIRLAFSLCLRCLPKKSRVGSLRRKTAVTVCLFWLLAATLSMLGEQTHCGGGGGGFALCDTTDCTSFQHLCHASFPPHCSFVRVQNIFLFFCWSSTKQSVTTLVSPRSRSKNEWLAGIQHWCCQ